MLPAQARRPMLFAFPCLITLLLCQILRYYLRCSADMLLSILRLLRFLRDFTTTPFAPALPYARVRCRAAYRPAATRCQRPAYMRALLMMPAMALPPRARWRQREGEMPKSKEGACADMALSLDVCCLCRVFQSPTIRMSPRFVFFPPGSYVCLSASMPAILHVGLFSTALLICRFPRDVRETMMRCC